MIQNAEKFIERFDKDFQAYLNPDNSFLFVCQGESNSTAKTIHIPNYSTLITGPAADGDSLSTVTWGGDSTSVTQAKFRTNVIKIEDYTEFFTANDKRQNAMVAMKGFIDTKIGDYAAYSIAPTSSANTVFTTGTVTRPSALEGSGNTVKSITKADFIKVRNLMNKSGFQGGKWYGLVDPDSLSDLFLIDDFVKADATGEARSRLMNGEFVTILGITLFMRHAFYGANVAYTTGGTLTNVYGAANSAGESQSATTITSAHVGGCIFWNDMAVKRNSGMAKSYLTIDDAKEQATILSMQYTYGLNKVRLDGKGTIALIETKV